MPKIPGGYILYARKTLESSIMDKPPLTMKLFTWMLLKANHKDGFGKMARGQFFTTISEMQDAMSWFVGYRKVTPSKQQIRNSYEALTNSTMINTKKTTRGLIITILNYETYQNPRNYEDHTEEHGDYATIPPTPTHYRQELKNDKKEDSTLTGTCDDEPPRCPQKEIITLYNTILPELPHCKSFAEKYGKMLKTRWREDAERQSLEWWENFFKTEIRTSDFLMGRVKEFMADLTWIVRPSNFTKIINGNYRNKKATRNQTTPVYY